MVSGRAQGFYISVNDIVSRTFQKLAFFSPVYGNREISCFFSSLLQISNLNRAEYFRSTTAGCSPWRSCGIDASSGKKKQFTRICKISKSDDFRIGLRLQIEWRTVGGSVAWCNGGISRKYFAGGWRRTFRGFRWLSLVLQVHGSRQILAKKIKIRHEAL